MDHMMPEMDGMEAAAAIRALGEDDPYFQTLPLVALTANVVSGQREKFLQNNFDDFLTKPIEMSKLDQILRRWIPRYKQQAQLSGDDSGRVESLEMEMPGINVKKGLRNAGGSVSLYMDILADFQRDAWKRMAQIKTALERSDSKGYIILVHGVKGSAKTLGAEDLGALAEKLEKAAATGDKESVDAESPLLLYQMEQLAERIGVALRRREEKELTRPDSPEPADDLYLDARALKLDQLKAGLEKMDITAVNYILLEYSGAPLKGPVRNFIAEIEQHILNFEYTEAVEKIKPHLRY
jgi:CheY-like chemotaxis protein